MISRFATPWPALVALALLPACATPSRLPTDPLQAEAAVRELLVQAATSATDRLGRPNGYYGDPQIRIPSPEPVARLEQGLRRYGLERYADELVLGMNRAAETAMPAVKPVLLETARGIRLSDAVAIIGGDSDAATRYFRTHTENDLAVRIKPLVADATARVGVLASYKRLLRKAAVLNRSLDLSRLDLDAYITRETLAGLFIAMAEEERRLRANPVGSGVDMLQRMFR